MINGCHGSPPRFQGMHMGILHEELNFESPRYYSITMIGEKMPAIKQGDVRLNGQPIGNFKSVARLSQDLAKGKMDAVTKRVKQVAKEMIEKVDVSSLGDNKVFGWEAGKLRSVKEQFELNKQAFLKMIDEAEPKPSILRDHDGNPIFHMMYLGSKSWSA